MFALRCIRIGLLGTDPGLHRMLRYWVATCILYLFCIGLLLVQVGQGITSKSAANQLIVFGGVGALAFYLLIRANLRLKLAPDQLAIAQALFSLICGIWSYTICGPLRAAMLVMTVVIIVFCMFALRPRQTLILSATAIFGMGAAMWCLQAKDPKHFPPMTEAITFGYLVGALLSTAILSGEMSKLRLRLRNQKHELSEALNTIKVLATIDELTSLINRRYMNEVLKLEERRHCYAANTCIALLDIDYFKRINDIYGHGIGDEVLRCFSAVARASLRANDVLARWGGRNSCCCFLIQDRVMPMLF